MDYGDSGYTGWFDGWQNARQRRAIEGLETEIGALSSSLYRQRSESARLRSQVSQLAGTLEQRVNRLTSSLAALVELSDVRAVLAMFDAPALVRHWAREAITAVVDAGKPVEHLPSPAADVDGYWLGPAVQALVALVRGEDAAAALALAQQRDQRRTALLLTCGLVLGGRPELAERWLADALGRLSPGTQVTVAQRALWIVFAGGGFGSAGEAVLRLRLTELVDALTREQEEAECEAWRGLVSGLSDTGVRLPEAVRADPSAQASVTGSLSAGARLAALRELCSAEEPERQALDDAAAEVLTEVLHGLVDEGTPEEAPLLRRTVELRATIEDGAGAASPRAWDGEAGDPAELLRVDAEDTGRPALAAAARYAGRRRLLDAATELAEATAITPPASVTVPVPGGHELRVGRSGADGWDLTRVRSEIEERPVVDPVKDKITVGLAIGGGALCLPVLAWPNGLAVLSVLAGVGLLITAGVRWHRERGARADRIYRRDADLARLDQQVEQAGAQLNEVHQRVSETRERAIADLAAIRSRLAG